MLAAWRPRELYWVLVVSSPAFQRASLAAQMKPEPENDGRRWRPDYGRRSSLVILAVALLLVER